MNRFAAAATALIAAGLLASAAPAQGPMAAAGIVPDVPSATDRPDPTLTYKLAFDMKSMAASADAVSPAMLGMARVLNTLRAHGVTADHIQATAVFHGPTIVQITTDQTYRNRTGAKANPNVALVRDLVASGVKIVICGVSARDQKYVAADMLPGATFNMSATTTFIDLGTRGYVTVER